MLKPRRIIAVMVAVCLMVAALPQPSYAAMLSTSAAVAPDNRARIAAALERADVRAGLAAYGVDAKEIKARVAALSDEEAAQVAGKLDALPAGGDAGLGAVVGAAVLVFLVLLLTDILGLTHVFPFTKPIHR